MAYKEGLRELELFSWGKKNLYSATKKKVIEDIGSPLRSTVKMKEATREIVFSLDIRVIAFVMRVIKHWSGLLREAMESSSLERVPVHP